MQQSAGPRIWQESRESRASQGKDGLWDHSAEVIWSKLSIMQAHTVKKKGHAEVNTSWNLRKRWCGNMTPEKNNSSFRRTCYSFSLQFLEDYLWLRFSTRGWLMWICCPYGRQPVVLFYSHPFHAAFTFTKQWCTADIHHDCWLGWHLVSSRTTHLNSCYMLK